jgi:hypothetical protein
MSGTLQKYLRDLGVGALGATLAVVATFTFIRWTAAPAVTNTTAERAPPHSGHGDVPSPLYHVIPSGAGTIGTTLPSLPSDVGSEVGAAPELDAVAEERAEIEAIGVNFAKQFDSEGVDGGWSRASEATLHESLSNLGKQAGFRIDRVSCKTTVCSGNVTFEPEADRGKATSKILHAAYSPNCAVSVLGAGTDRGTVRFNCEHARVQQFEASAR